LTLTGILLVGGLGAGASWLAHRDDLGRRLRIDPAQLNLGEVWLQEEIEHRVFLTNNSPQEITISTLAASCACTSIEPTSFRLRSAESRPVMLRINLFKVARQDWNADFWPLNIQLSAYRRDVPGAVAIWRISGAIISPFRAIPKPDRDILSVERFAPPESTCFELKLKPGIQIRDVSSVQPGVSCCVTMNEKTGNPCVVMKIDPSKRDAGVFVSRVDLRLADSNGTDLPPLPLEMPVSITPSVTLDPDLLLLNSMEPSTVHLRSAVDQPFAIDEVISVEGVHVAVSPAESDFLSHRRLTIRAIATNETLSLIPVQIRVRMQHSGASDKLTLRVQLPTSR
jgi:hypothetical protein